MSKDRDKSNKGLPEGGEVFSLEDILSEYGSGAGCPPAPARASATGPPGEKVIPFPGTAPLGEEDGGDEEGLLAEGVRRLREGLDGYADQMFEAEGLEDAEETRRMERLIPGVDREDNAPRAWRERKPRPAPEPIPDLSPAELFHKYGAGLSGLRVRCAALFLLALPQVYLALAFSLSLPLPGVIARQYTLVVYLSGGLLAAAMALSLDVLGRSLAGLFRGRMGLDTLTTLACAATLADSLTMLRLGGRGDGLPYCGAATLGLGCMLWGTYLKRRALRQTCRTAAFTAEPYLVTLDEGKWNGRDTYIKWKGPPHGFGAQVQAEDGAARVFRVAAPLLLLACVLFSLISSLGRRQPEQLLWCLSATLTASASFSGLLCFALPMDKVAARLAGSGAALAGWEAARWSGAGSGVVISDTDLFPPGTVTMNGIKIFGDYPVEKVVAVTATLIRDAGSGLEKTFHDLLRAQGAVYRRAAGHSYHEGGGVSAEIRGEQILVGSAAFMTLMEVTLPRGLNVKNAVFCAIDGELAGVFALHYALLGAVPPALTALIQNKIPPVLATRDFNLIPDMLRQKFKLPVERMEFPEVRRRRELSDPEQAHKGTLTAILCREGLVPFSEAVIGARRLHRAVLQNTGLTCVGAVTGALLAFYLTFQGAYASLSAGNLILFLLLWTVPTLLISGWVDRY
ncbi:MAG: hypothetical protein GX585_04365 [Clostridiales bacterium]|nr:hypothetical protein [Clostridiales bacterium]